jgi:outer membrane lipopolysaccharide assembly protein LptE/RlpB
MKTFTFRFILLVLTTLLSGCGVSLRSMIATPAPTTLPTPIWDFYELLNQAATQAPFTLLIPDEAKLPFAIEHTGLDFIPGSKIQPFVVM